MAETSIKNVTRAELSEAIYHEIGLSSSESAHLLDQVLEEISKALEKAFVFWDVFCPAKEDARRS